MRLFEIVVLASVLLNAGCSTPRLEAATTAMDSGFVVDEAEKRRLIAEADRGSAEAAFSLSLHYSSAGDRMSASKWNMVAAQKGHAIAQYNQWFELRDSSNCAGQEEALSWLEKSAAAGFASATKKLPGYRMKIAKCLGDSAP